MAKSEIDSLVSEASSSIRQVYLDNPENDVLLEAVVKAFIMEAVRTTEEKAAEAANKIGKKKERKSDD